MASGRQRIETTTVKRLRSVADNLRLQAGALEWLAADLEKYDARESRLEPSRRRKRIRKALLARKARA